MTENIQENEAIVIECKDCGIPFEFTEGEQAFFRDNNLQAPKRCSLCRLKKRQRFAEEDNSQR